ncbi:TraI domain-containing protein [Serratia sp. L9]|uniref:TraI domain-containing protein n=1 Tax=Serratia sp. L9 TaxID=3423946 RepID=UPI003D672F28
MVDHLLETAGYAARLSKNYLLPIGAQPEEQASQSAAWNAVIVFAVMVQSFDRLCQIVAELESGQRWMPLNAMPGEPHRFRHSVATNMMKSPDHHIQAVKRLLGHSSSRSTQEYIDEDVESLRDIMEQEGE